LVAAGLVQADLAGIDEDLVLARIEPSSVRPDAAWLERRQRASEEIGALCGVLVLGAGTDARAAAAVGERLEALADAAEGRGARDRAERVGERGAGLPAWEPFRSAVEGGLGRLEDTLDTGGEDAADAVLAGA
jgi:hypothetical protein